MKILVLGAGRMGYGAVFDLINNSADVTHVTVADADDEKLRQISEQIDSPKLEVVNLDVSKYEDTVSLMNRHDSAISCVNYWYNLELSQIAIETLTNFCDLGGNNTIVDEQLALDSEARAPESILFRIAVSRPEWFRFLRLMVQNVLMQSMKFTYASAVFRRSLKQHLNINSFFRSKV